jgi:hypothetical protein
MGLPRRRLRREQADDALDLEAFLYWKQHYNLENLKFEGSVGASGR